MGDAENDGLVVELHSRTEMHGAFRRSTGEYPPRAPLALVTLGHRSSGTFAKARCHQDAGLFSLGLVAETV